MNRFLLQLAHLDKTLFIILDKQRQRFVVFRRDRKNFPREILVIEDEQGDFCYPGYVHIAKLYMMDSWANKRLIQDMDEYNDHLEDDADAKIAFLSNEVSKLATRSAYF